MDNNEQRAIATDYIKGLSFKQVVEFFYETTGSTTMWVYEDEEESRHFQDIKEHLVIARALGENDVEGNFVWRLNAVALEDSDRYNGATFSDDSSPNQRGQCNCGHHLTSWTKHVVCPVCGTKFRLQG